MTSNNRDCSTPAKSMTATCHPHSALLARTRASSRAQPLTALQRPMELPHAHASHAPVYLHRKPLLLPCGHAVTLLLPCEPEAVETMHRLEGELHADTVWCEVWPSAFALADELLSSPSLVAGKRVCELGAGVALAGIAAAMAGAAVTMTDREPRALWCALAGAAASGVLVATPTGLPAGLPPLPPFDCAPTVHGQPASVALLDWDAPLPPHLRGSFDVLLLCDVLYQPGSIDALARVTAHLLAERGRLLLADTAHRPGKEGLRARFLDALLASGGRRLAVRSSRVVTVHMPAPALDVNTGDAHPVELLVIEPAEE